MKKMRHTEEQIAFALKQAETGTSVAEVDVVRPRSRGGRENSRSRAVVGCGDQ